MCSLYNSQRTQTAYGITCGISAGVMGFKYKVRVTRCNYTNITSTTGQSELMKAAVCLQTIDIPNDPLVLNPILKIATASNDRQRRNVA